MLQEKFFLIHKIRFWLGLRHRLRCSLQRSTVCAAL